jgi:flagellar motility protein MotE (MotC chaperone)
MSRMPRILPLVGVAIAGVVAINALEGGPGMIGAVKSFAEDVISPKSKSALAANASLAAPVAKPPAPVCAPTAAELAKEAGLSPAELQVLQSLGARRGQLDQREGDLDTQVQLIAAAEAKLNARIAQMNGLKGDIQGLLNQADQAQAAETDRLVRVYEAMKPKDAAGRMTLMSDAVRLPIAAKMKERALAAMLAQMPAEDAKALTEKLANQVAGSQALANARTALNPPAQPAPAQAAATPPPSQTAQAASPKAAAPQPKAAAAPAPPQAQASQDQATPDQPAQAQAAAKPAKPRHVARARKRAPVQAEAAAPPPAAAAAKSG